MMLPRDMSGDELVRLLHRHYAYRVVRQRGSHIRLVTYIKGSEHHVSIPRHSQLKVGTLHVILSRVAAYLEISQSELRKQLFGS
ncbi:MAG: type II toxin-antitoxin system HicA family toxin [Gemmatimonadetes bacterium]|nr:type II toxin-antitoxin system HicA family toxin [Gemmatimonadota bacterium]MXY80547.1 type II toxin-antitoxin system HicA family toxin [Gemmatimonadota bacterium]MYB70492.1 type II toxin-antitoxin system HicA family toxin [Gemmatimonadota bacterium]